MPIHNPKEHNLRVVDIPVDNVVIEADPTTRTALGTLTSLAAHIVISSGLPDEVSLHVARSKVPHTDSAGYKLECSAGTTPSYIAARKGRLYFMEMDLPGPSADVKASMVVLRGVLMPPPSGFHGWCMRIGSAQRCFPLGNAANQFREHQIMAHLLTLSSTVNSLAKALLEMKKLRPMPGWHYGWRRRLDGIYTRMDNPLAGHVK